jgi:hypothetical protein
MQQKIHIQSTLMYNMRKKNLGQINLASHSEDDNNMNMQSIVEKGKHIHMVVVTISREYLMENL